MIIKLGKDIDTKGSGAVDKHWVLTSILWDFEAKRVTATLYGYTSKQDYDDGKNYNNRQVVVITNNTLDTETPHTQYDDFFIRGLKNSIANQLKKHLREVNPVFSGADDESD